MKVNSRLIALMVSLAAGSAAAAGSGLTPAGTVISNTATAKFEDPTGPSGNTNGSVTSNAVTTTVQAKPAFDIVYTDGSDATTPTTPATGYDRPDILPNGVVDTNYVILNNGNVGSNTPAGTPYVVTVTPNYGGTVAPAGTVVQYFNGATKIYDSSDLVNYPGTVAVLADDPATAADEGQLTIKQSVIIPATAATGTLFSVSPQGNAAVYNSATNTSPATSEATTDLQYTQIKIYTPNVDVVPNDTANPTTPVTTVVTPPTGTTGTPVTNPNNPVSDPSTGDTGTTPGYVDPASPTTAITSNSAGDSQVAYPIADTNTTADVVTFVNKVTNVGLADVVNLFPTDSSGLPIGTNNGDGSFTLPDGTIVKFLNPDGTPATLVNGYPTVIVPAGTSTTPGVAYFQTQVTYADSNSTPNPAPVVILVGIDSANDTGVKADATSTDTIMPANMQFGDATAALGTDPTPVTTQTVSPKVAPAAGNITSSPDTTDNTAVFPMDIVNQGEYGDSYTLTTPTTPIFPVTNGGTPTYKYVDSTGAELPKNAAGNYITPVVAPNEEYKVFLVVTVPDDALAGSVTIPQTATGNYSTIVANDPNDVVKIGIINTNPDPITGNPTSGIDVDKYQTVDTAADPAVVAAPVPTVAEKNAVTALPGDTLRYAIIAKNNYNTSVANFVLSDSAAANNVYTYSNLVSATATPTGFTIDTTLPYAPNSVLSATVYYKWTGTKAGVSVLSAGFVTAPPTASDMDTVTTLEVAVDTNGDNAITAADIVPATATIRLDIAVTIK